MFRKGHCLSLKRSPFVLYFNMFYKLIVYFAKTYFLTLTTAHTNSCVLRLWHFLKSVRPRWPLIVNAETMTRAPSITSGFYGPHERPPLFCD